jgi:hypothetical protein
VLNEIAGAGQIVLEFKIINTTIVVAAEAHNPTILHPAFLRAEKIVPRDWEQTRISMQLFRARILKVRAVFMVGVVEQHFVQALAIKDFGTF